MRPAALLTLVCALSTSATAQSSFNVGDLTASAAALASSFETANPTAVWSQVNSMATGALATLSEIAATATGPLGSSLRAEYTSLKSQLAGAQNTASSALGLTGSGSAPTPSGSVTPASAGLAPATAVPIAAVGLGMAVLGFL